MCDHKVEAITVRQLLQHTGGGYSNKNPDPMFSLQGCSQEELIAATLRERGLDNGPGTVYSYSNFGYCLLGRVIEDASGVPYEEYIARNILDKVGAQGTCSEQPGQVQYFTSERGDEGWVLSPSMRSDALVSRMDAHGGWRLSASELVRVSQGIEDGTLLSAESRSLLVTPSPVSGNYGLGCCVNFHARWHTGALKGTASVLVRTSSWGGMSWALVVNCHDEAQFPYGKLDGFAWQCVEDVHAHLKAAAGD